MLSVEGVIYNTTEVEGSSTASYWFKNDTVQWVDTEIKCDESNLSDDAKSLGYDSPEYRRNCTIDNRGRQSSNSSGVIVHGFEDVDSATGDYYDDICARIEWIPPERNDGEHWTARPIINPTNIFKRIIRKYNGEIGNNVTTSTLGDTTSKDSYVKILPNMSSSTIDNIPKGTKIKILDDFNTWVKVSYGDNKTGYIPRSFISATVNELGYSSGTGRFQIDSNNVDESLWVDATSFNGTITQTACPASDFIVNTLCKIAVKPKAKSAGFNYFLKNGKHCFKAIDYSKTDSSKTIKAGYYVQDSNVISFSVNQIGAMVMAGAETDPDTGEVLVDVSAVDSLTGEIITQEGYFAEGYYISEEAMNESNKTNSTSWDNRTVSSAKVISSSSKSLLNVTWSDVFSKISEFTISASLTIWGEYNNTYIPGNYIDVTVMTPDGHKHYSSGNYYIISADDSVTADGYTTTLKLLKVTDRTSQTFNSDFTAEKVTPGTYAYGVDPYSDDGEITTTTTVSVAGKTTNYNSATYVRQTSSTIEDYSTLLTVSNLSNEKKQFIVDVGTIARKYWKPFHIYPSNVIAQAALESGWGKSDFAKSRNNYFGINAFDSNPGKASYYSSLEECILAYYLKTYWGSASGASSKTGESYSYKDVISATSASKQMKAIGGCGYASDVNYYTKLNSIVNSAKLTLWDGALDNFTADTSKKGKYSWSDFWPPKS